MSRSDDYNDTQVLDFIYEVCENDGIYCVEGLEKASRAEDAAMKDKFSKAYMKHYESGKFAKDRLRAIMDYSDDEELKQKLAPQYFENLLKSCEESAYGGKNCKFNRFKVEPPKEYYDKLMEILTKNCNELDRKAYCITLSMIFEKGIEDKKATDIIPINREKANKYSKKADSLAISNCVDNKEPEFSCDAFIFNYQHGGYEGIFNTACGNGVAFACAGIDNFQKACELDAKYCSQAWVESMKSSDKESAQKYGEKFCQVAENKSNPMCLIYF